MMKKALFFTYLFIFSEMTSAQQNPIFSQVKQFYEVNIKQIGNEYSREYGTLTNNDDKALLSLQYKQVMQQVDSMRNQAFVGALIQTKNEEQLDRLRDSIQQRIVKSDTRGLKPAVYSGGNKALKNILMHLIHFDETGDKNKVFSSRVSFVVETDGNISHVNASGANPLFNRQVEVAFYLLPEKFTPAKYKNQWVRSYVDFPYSLKID